MGRPAAKSRTSGSSTTWLGRSRSAPASKTQRGTWHFVSCRRNGGIGAQSSLQRPRGPPAPDAQQNTEPIAPSRGSAGYRLPWTPVLGTDFHLFPRKKSLQATQGDSEGIAC